MQEEISLYKPLKAKRMLQGGVTLGIELNF